VLTPQVAPTSTPQVRGHVLLTGATGLVGGAVLAELLGRADVEVICLVRAGDRTTARARVTASLAHWLDGDELDRTARRLHVVPADLTRAGLGLDRRDRAELAGHMSHVVHCAASVRFDDPLALARSVNVEGASRVLQLAAEAASCGVLERAVMVSTAFVSGSTARRFSEHELDRGQAFRTTYERSKFEAELLARQAMAHLPVTVVRPSIVIGHSRSGRTPAFNVLYAPLRLLLKHGTDVTLPVRADLALDAVPVDWVARLIVQALTAGEDGQTYAAAAGARALTMRDLAEVTSEVFDVPTPGLLPVAASDGVVSASLAAWRHRLSARGRAVMAVYEPYLVSGSVFDSWRGDHLMWRAGVEQFDPRSALRRSLEYARTTDFGRSLRAGSRTPEQAPSAA
jgi:thioester reductase-like protein